MIEHIFSLKGKNALITGGTHGIGLAIAEALGMAGATLFINGHSPDRLKNAVNTLIQKGMNTSGYLFDITQEQEVIDNIELIEETKGPIDILVNNAAIHRRVPLMDISYSEFQEVIQTNLNGQFLVAREVASRMLSRKAGKIVNMCSMMSEVGRDTVGAYSAAKGGLKMLTKSMATEWAQYNIQTNGIGPGYIKTEATGPIGTPGNPIHDFIIDRTPTGRWGAPEDLQGAAIFLSSRASDYVNGQIIYVDGGMLATLGKPSSKK